MLCAVLRAVRNLVECYVTVVKLSKNLTKVFVINLNSVTIETTGTSKTLGRHK